MVSDDELLRGLCAGDLPAGDELWRRRVDVWIEQRLVASCARADPRALERFAAAYLGGLDPALRREALAAGAIASLCARHSEDVALLTRFAAGNESAGQELFARYYPVLDRFVASKVPDLEVAADLIQETFKDLVKQRAQIESFRPFMFRVAVNKIGAWYSRRYGRPAPEGTSGLSDLPELRGVVSQDRDKQQHKLLLLALQQLSLLEQLVIELYTWEEFTAEEVGQILGLPLHKIRHTLRNAKQKMAEFVARGGADAARRAATDELDAFFARLRARADERVAAR